MPWWRSGCKSDGCGFDFYSGNYLFLFSRSVKKIKFDAKFHHPTPNVLMIERETK